MTISSGNKQHGFAFLTKFRAIDEPKFGYDKVKHSLQSGRDNIMRNRAVRFFISSEKIILSSIITIFLVGCATGSDFRVSVDSISAPETESKKKYVLLPLLENVQETDLQFQEYATYVKRALTSRGFVKVSSLEDANIAIFLAYGIGNPQEKMFSYALPIWGQTGVSSSITSGTVTTFGNTATYSGSTTYTPTYGTTGYMPIVGLYVHYFRFLILDAVDLDEYRQTQKITQLWQTTATSTGSSDDLRRVFPILVAAIKPYLGTNTGQKVRIRLTDDDQSVLEIKGIGN